MQRTVSDGKLRRPAYDGNGNITAWALKGSGGTANPNMEQLRTEYDAFGNIVVSEGTLNSEFGFSTKIRDPYTGLCYYGYRYYDPVTGRWPSRDAIGERGGVNFYGFVGNDGVNWWDYLGWWKKGDEIKVKCGGMMSKVAGKIKVADYSVEKGQVTQTDGLRCQGALATLTLKFEESDPKCCCKNGKYQWFQTITEDNDPGKANKKVPRSDAGPPSLATLVGTDFDDNPGIPAKNVEALWKRDGGKHMKKGAKIEVKFKLEFQCKEDGKEARTLKTIKWGLWYSVDKCGVTKAGVE
ncbi:RHS repeat-associated protein [Haloferula luteola]|uniref:RHS repeat-associated protein n=2 Tax=Haloferula luteola TaxID=595692 RepID=A0A840VHE7_9BACT|nr:RHS repeat-associated protein [Haloferula luteola]